LKQGTNLGNLRMEQGIAHEAHTERIHHHRLRQHQDTATMLPAEGLATHSNATSAGESHFRMEEPSSTLPLSAEMRMPLLEARLP